MAKYLLIAAIVISLVTAGLGFKNHDTLVTTKATLADTETNLASTKKTLTTTQGELKTTKETLATTESDKEKIASDLTAANADLSKTKGDLDTATKDAAEKGSQIADLQKTIDDLKASMPENQQGPGGLKEMVDKLNQTIAEQGAQIASLSEKNKADTATIKTFQDKEAERAKNVMKPGIEGQVLAVNPAWNFVVLSIGDKQGAVNNAEMLIKRGGQYLGKVRITSVEPSTSIADIVANTLPDGVAVQPGDSVIYQVQE